MIHKKNEEKTHIKPLCFSKYFYYEIVAKFRLSY